MRFTHLVAALGILAMGCAPHIVVLQPPPSPDLAASSSPLRVLASVDHAPDPIPLQGENLAFAGVPEALGQSIAAACAPWARKHQARRPGGWELHVELISARAEVEHGERTAELAARVTLTATIGQVFLAQTHGYCRVADSVDGEGGRALYACMAEMSRDLEGWLEGVQP